MGPAVSRPDDWWVLGYVDTANALQWGRPFRGRMTSGTSNRATCSCSLQWGRPFRGRMTQERDEHPMAVYELQWGRPFRGRMTGRSAGWGRGSGDCFNGAGRFAAG